MPNTKILSLEMLSEEELKEYFERYPVAIPTETVYGLASTISNKKTTALIYKIKNRPSVNPLILHISNLNMLENLIELMPMCYKSLIEKFWPGPLSLLFKTSSYTRQFIESDYICIRMPSNNIALSIINKLNEPLFAPSANLSGKISPTSSKHVFDDLNNKIELIIEGGQSIYGLESTIFDFKSMKVLRPGHISEEEIYAVLKKTSINEIIENKNKDFNSPEEINSPEEVICPGTKFKHYSPENDLILFKTKEELNKLLENLKKKKRLYRISILYSNKENLDFENLEKHEEYCPSRDYTSKDYMSQKENIILLFNFGKNFLEISYNFYDFLRKADKISDIIFCESFEGKEGAVAIMDRMNRAAQK